MRINNPILPLVFALILGIGHLTPAPAQSAPQVPSESDVVSKRAQEFYTFLQLRQFSKAEAYATKQTRERLRDQANNPFIGFKIHSVDVDSAKGTAKVQVDITVMAAFMGGTTQLTRDTEWRLEDGEWRIVIPEVPASGVNDVMAMGRGEPPKPEELKFKGKDYNFGVVKTGERQRIHFPFSNESDHVVTIDRVFTDCDCLKDVTSKRQFKPGESGEVVLEFDTTGIEYQYEQTIVVQTQPTGAKSYLHIEGEIVPKAIAYPESADAPRQSDGSSARQSTTKGN